MAALEVNWLINRDLINYSAASVIVRSSIR